jgi:hypothetical protein
MTLGTTIPAPLSTTFQALPYPSTISELGQDQIFRKIGCVLSASEVLSLCDAVRKFTPEAILQLIEHHCHDCKEKESMAKQDPS